MEEKHTSTAMSGSMTSLLPMYHPATIHTSRLQVKLDKLKGRVKLIQVCLAATVILIMISSLVSTFQIKFMSKAITVELSQSQSMQVSIQKPEVTSLTFGELWNELKEVQKVIREEKLIIPDNTVITMYNDNSRCLNIDAALSLILNDDIPIDVNGITPTESSDEDDDVRPSSDLSHLLYQVRCNLEDTHEDDSNHGSNHEQQNESEILNPSNKDDDHQPIATDSRKWKKASSETDYGTFSNPEGPVLEEFADCSTATDFFLKYYDVNVRQNIVYQTNLYATQQSKLFQPLTDDELQVFVGINLLMGYHELPQYRLYWEKSEDVNVDLVSSAMTRDRFCGILSNLHVNDNLTIQATCTDKLYKLRPLLNSLNENFKQLWNPNEVQSIDESMVKFKGRHSIKQYNPMKPIKRGFKIWVRSEMSGHTNAFQIYQGKHETYGDDTKRLGLGGGVVLHLSKPLFGNNHKIYFDNYFTSVPLLEELKANGVKACGTIRSNRKGLPELKSDSKLKKGEFDYRSSNTGVTFFKWKDNKSVHVLSNFHGTEEDKVMRTEKDGSKKEFSCPKSIKDYNSHMGGVDKADMLKALYGINRKSNKWWHRIFFHLIDVCVVNAYVAYCSLFVEIPLLEYRRRLTKGLIVMSKKNQKKRGRPSFSPPSKRTNAKKRGYTTCDDVRTSELGIHRIKFTDTRARCEYCAYNGIQSRPFSICEVCGVYLCCNPNKNCFDLYHYD